MKKLIILGILSIFTTYGLKAQNEIDALRYSRLNYSGSARFVSMGGAFGALGADFTSLSHNPAGIGLYRSSEISITPSINISNTEATLNGTFRDDSRYNFNLGSVGIVMNNNLESRNQQSLWKNVQFGFGLNRMANFNNRVSIESENLVSSFLTSYWENAQGIHPDDLGSFDTRLAYDTELLFITDSASWEYGIDKPFGGVNQRKNIESKGSINEMVFTLGANYNNKLYLGATIGVPYIRYYETATYTETALADDNTVFNSMTRTDLLETTGTGLNFKFGLIFRATDWLRLGGAIHTPTFYTSMSDDYTATMRSRFDNGYSASAKANGFYEYELTTPMRAIGSIGFIIGKAGVISADYEFVDYSAARLRASDYDFYDENNAIRSIYQKANNLRFGTEWRYGALNFRGGYGLSANPYVYGTNSALSSYSLGIGIRERSFYFDMAWVYSTYDDMYYLYSGNVKAANTTTMNNAFMVTLGIKY
ncbi:hypothetical protein SDC9_21570 [bioreactor metagenome]|jgi:hypothetical protein|uniref:Outer membrane protein transport protein (OMPP1/FadL/TodX) n=1 Tax=bioreactor metagenome TaxID=1076179 RepID=A0A644U9V3_9ZZZZ|nr:hypothetical protein [Lentimicrobium sp.]MEA5110730.1 hypothetical protein [Lentimicrobium sp.]HCT72277.1 hypothetical protein [Bacteroidales bacterium]